MEERVHTLRQNTEGTRAGLQRYPWGEGGG